MAGRNVQFAANGGSAEGYLATPEGGSGPGVIVIQEWWGLVPHIEDVTRRFADEGYVALAPDLYHGRSTVEAEEAHHLMEGLDWDRATAEIVGAVRHLRESEGAAKVGLIGFCAGGALLMVAAARDGADAYASFYGFPRGGPAAELDRIEAPGIIFFGEQENVFSIPDAQAFAERQRERGREAELLVYPDAGHGFFNDTRPAYREGPARDAWARTLALFERHLR